MYSDLRSLIDLRSGARRPQGLIVAAILLALAPGLVAQAPTREYVVGAQDVLLVTVFGQPELTGKFAVGADGSLNFPYVGRVKVAGLTARGVERALFDKLSPGFLRNPQIAVSVDAYRSQQFHVLGEVNLPGSYYLTGQATLIRALAQAGSIKGDAGDDVLLVRPRVRSGGGPVLPDQADEKDVRLISLGQLTSGELGETIWIQDGDTIFVPRAEQIFVVGQVKNPGSYRYSKTLTILQLLSMAGGATERGATNRIKIVRVVDGKKQQIKATLNDTLKPNDTILVPEKWF